MPAEVMQAGDACKKIRQLEQLLEWPVACVVVATKPDELAFLIPSEAADTYVRWLMERVASAAQDASKSL